MWNGPYLHCSSVAVAERVQADIQQRYDDERGQLHENPFSNHDEILNLLIHCWMAFKRHLFPGFIKLCGTSDALDALVAAHVEEVQALSIRRRALENQRGLEHSAIPEHVPLGIRAESRSQRAGRRTLRVQEEDMILRKADCIH